MQCKNGLPEGLNWLCYFTGSSKSQRENSILSSSRNEKCCQILQTLFWVFQYSRIHTARDLSIMNLRLLRHSALTRLTLESSDVAPTFMVAARSSRICFAAKQSYQKLTQLSAVQCNAVFFFFSLRPFGFFFCCCLHCFSLWGSDTTGTRLLSALLQQRLYNIRKVFTCNSLSLMAGR